MKDYKKILEGVVDIINTTEKSDIGFANICAYIGENCPELKESEDERIRKELISLVKETKVTDRYYDLNKLLVWLEKQGEQKPAWSEYDEEFLLELSQCCDLNKTQVQWLLSLKDRVQPQQKHEWSKEDEKMVGRIENALSGTHYNYYYKDSREMTDWLKSLRPHSQWKPSDEQMKALKHAFNNCSIAFADMKILATLYEQLKALHRYEQDT